MMRQAYALLGRQDEPTDAVEEYCRYLGAALQAHQINLQIRRVPWGIHGWGKAFRGLRLQAAEWRDTWVLVQYTALAWSSRGFPFKFLRALHILKSAGARVAVVFHDVTPYSSPRLIDQLRYRAQSHVMRRALQLAERAIFTIPLENVSWLGAPPEKAVFIPVGPNLPFPETSAPQPARELPTVGVFSITGGEPGERETKWIIDAVRSASQRIGPLSLSLFGRHAELREDALRKGLQNLPVQLSVEGVVDADQVINRLAACDVLFFVRNGISTRRSSAIAGIAAGLPIVAYANAETAAPITDAGVLLVNPDYPAEFGEALLRILTDTPLREELAGRSRAAYQAHFAWPAIAARYAALLESN
jgi:glycosyltransferase involved in cell wall biosynthesis